MADRVFPGLRACWTRADFRVLFLMLVLAVSILMTPGSATVYTFGGDGSSGSIQDLINTTVNGDSIYLAGGRYYENLQIDRSIVLGALDTTNPPEIVSSNVSDAAISLLSDGISLNGIVISGDARTGLLVKSGNNQIRGVTVGNFPLAIGMDSARSNILSGNTIVNNSRGVSLDRNSRSNTFYLNYFNNSQDVEALSADNIWSSGRQVYTYAGNEYTGQVGNYWGGYTGRDENGDGIGDTSYVIQSDGHGEIPTGGTPGAPAPGTSSGATDRAPLASPPASYTLVGVADLFNTSPFTGDVLRQPEGLPQQAIQQQGYQPLSNLPLSPEPSGERNPFVRYLAQYWWIIPIALLVSAIAGIWLERKWRGRAKPGAAGETDRSPSPNVTVVKKLLPPAQDREGGENHYAARLPPALERKYPGAEYVAEGGVSRVFRAWDGKEGRNVAVKIPIRFDEVTGTQFTKELHVWEGLHHKNIIEIYAANIFPVPYIEMEYVPSPLAAMQFPLETGQATAIITGIAEGLGYAHDQGIVHRDIKPGNIMITEEGIPKISDWGLSKAEGTKQSGIIGFSLEYAAPEQLAPNLYGEPGPWTDIYQLGVLFYEMLTGKVPFSGGGMGELTHAILHDDPVLPDIDGPDAARIRDIIMKCMAKKPEDRYTSVSMLLDDLGKIGS